MTEYEAGPVTPEAATVPDGAMVAVHDHTNAAWSPVFLGTAERHFMTDDKRLYYEVRLDCGNVILVRPNFLFEVPASVPPSAIVRTGGMA